MTGRATCDPTRKFGELQPGDERITLERAQRPHLKRALKRYVWTDRGHWTVWDEDAKDWLSGIGSWVEIQTLGHFNGTEDAGEYLRRTRP
jgi:hypothetical protein